MPVVFSDKGGGQMKRAHLIFGLMLFVVFLITGQFMRVDFPDKEAISQELRLLMRSRHIYILFSALLHVVLGIYLRNTSGGWRLLARFGGSLVLFGASVLLVWAFVAETYWHLGYSDLSRFGIYSSLFGAALHVIGGIGGEREP